MKQPLPSIMQTSPLFTGLDDDDKAILMQGGKLREYENGQPLFTHGDAVCNFSIICDGAVQLFRETPDGHEMTSDVLIAGDTIGETEILQPGSTHHFNAIAIKKTSLLEFPVGWLKESAKKYNLLALNLLGMLSQRLHIATIEAEHKTTMTAAQQVSCFMERLCILHDFDPRGFELPYSKTLIASRLGMELETFSRALKKMRDHGISIDGMRVSFDNIGEMERYVCGNCSIIGHCNEHEQLKKKLAAPAIRQSK